MRAIIDLMRRVAALEQRVSGMVRHGTVEEVDTKAGTVRLDLGEGDNGKFLSPKIPYGQVAGGLKVHAPPTKGQTMTVLAPGGDSQQGVAIPTTWSDKNKSPSEKGDENVLTFGNARISVKGDEVQVTIGGTSLTISGSSVKVATGGVTHEISGSGVEMKGGKVKHDDHSIGSDHTHTGVEPGGALTGPPK